MTSVPPERTEPDYYSYFSKKKQFNTLVKDRWKEETRNQEKESKTKETAHKESFRVGSLGPQSKVPRAQEPSEDDVNIGHPNPSIRSDLLAPASEVYDQRWSKTNQQNEEFKKEREKQRQERGKLQKEREKFHTLHRSTQELEKTVAKAQTEEWASVYHQTTTKEARELAKVVRSVLFQNAIQNESDDESDHYEDARTSLRKRRDHDKQGTIDDNNLTSNALSSWYQSKSVSRAMSSQTKPTSVPTGSQPLRSAKTGDVETQTTEEGDEQVTRIETRQSEPLNQPEEQEIYNQKEKTKGRQEELKEQEIEDEVVEEKRSTEETSVNAQENDQEVLKDWAEEEHENEEREGERDFEGREESQEDI